MGKIDYQKIYETNQDEWKALTREPQRYEALLAGHYSDSNHFVYELLQNAEDEHATKVVIEFYNDQLVFYHNGDPFNEDDVRGVSSMLMGTKDSNDAQTIGRFGMGFKSVFKYTYQPEIYSDEEAFIIKNYLLPVENHNQWDFQYTKANLFYPDTNDTQYAPFINTQHLTKIVIPFEKRNEKGEVISVDGTDVLHKLNSLSGEILLFLTFIRNLYWIDKENGKYVHITLSHAKGDEQLITCRITGSEGDGKEDVSRYLKYKKVFDHPEMRSAEVCVAYKLNTQARNVNEMEKTPIWVYFPTRDITDLPFLIHGSFETAVSREKLMSPSAFNDTLFDKLGDLIADSMTDLAHRNLITQVFLRRVVLGAFQDEVNNGTIKGLKDKITRVFSVESIIPDRVGEYRSKNELAIALPFQLAELKESTLWEESFASVDDFVAFNNERERNFNEYFSWLKDDLCIRVFDFARWATCISTIPTRSISLSEQEIKSIEELYSFLNTCREDNYRPTSSFSRGGPYENAIRKSIPQAWALLKQACIILNAENTLVSAYVGEKPNVYLSSSSQYREVLPSCIVNPTVSDQFKSLLSEGFNITVFDNIQFIKETIIEKYQKQRFSSKGTDKKERSDEEYVGDIRQLIELLKEVGDTGEILSIIKSTPIIKIQSSGTENLECPEKIYIPISDEGVDLNILYSPVMIEETIGEKTAPGTTSYIPIGEYSFRRYPLDVEYYETNGISLQSLKSFGFISSAISEGKRYNHNGIGDGYWEALGDFRPNLLIFGLEPNLQYIQNHQYNSLAQKKSAELLRLLLIIHNKLYGTIRRRKKDPYELQESAEIINLLEKYNWIYTQDNQLSVPSKLSRFDLNETVYQGISSSKEAYTALGFIEKERDITEETFEKVEAMKPRDQKLLFRQLARSLGYDITKIETSFGDEFTTDNETFIPNEWQSSDFPQRKVLNMEYLIDRVRQEFYFSNPTKYSSVLRHIRISNDPKRNREYALGMYLNDSRSYTCQMCKHTTMNAETIEIANFGIEMPQLHLCLCRNCATKYKQWRDENKKFFKEAINKEIEKINTDDSSETYDICLPNCEDKVHFTQTHIVEVREILQLLSIYGIPEKEVPNDGIDSSKSQNFEQSHLECTAPLSGKNETHNNKKISIIEEKNLIIQQPTEDIVITEDIISSIKDKSQTITPDIPKEVNNHLPSLSGDSYIQGEWRRISDYNRHVLLHGQEAKLFSKLFLDEETINFFGVSKGHEKVKITFHNTEFSCSVNPIEVASYNCVLLLPYEITKRIRKKAQRDSMVELSFQHLPRNRFSIRIVEPNQ